MKKAIVSLLFLSLSVHLLAQQAMIEGRVIDKETEEALPFASVLLFDSTDTLQVGVATTDFEGRYVINQLKAGTYHLKVTYVGYSDMIVKDISLSAGKKTYCKIAMSAGVDLQVMEVFFHKELTEHDNTATGTTMRREDIQRLPVRSVTEIHTLSSGVVYGQIRGTRSGATQTYIDGIKVVGSTNVPKAAVGEVNVITGGIPAQYGNETYEKPDENNYFPVTANPVSTFSIDVDAASYSNIRRMIRDGYLPPKEAVRTEEMINYFHYDYPAPQGNEPFTVYTEFGPCAWNKKHLLLRVALQGKKVDMETLPPSNITFLLDVSGSMADQNKLPLLKRSLRLLVNQLRPEDRVAIVVYASSSRVVLPSTPGDRKEVILDAIDGLRADGSTNGGSGIQRAYRIAEQNFVKKGNNRVILATDGDFNVGISQDDALVQLIEEKRDLGIFLTVLGFGMGNLKDAKLEKLADNGNGHYAYIDDFLEAKKVMINELGANLMTIAKDVKLQIEFNPAKIKAYRLIGYENRLLAREDFNNDVKDAGDMGAGHSVTALYEVVPADIEEDFEGKKVDELKYQEVKLKEEATSGNEALTVKVRFKEPDEKTSQLRVIEVEFEKKEMEETTLDFRFLTSIAQFAMLLSDSKYLGETTYQNTIELAMQSKGEDEDGYRSEFVELVKLSGRMK